MCAYGQQYTGTMAERQFMRNGIVKGTKNSMWLERLFYPVAPPVKY